MTDTVSTLTEFGRALRAEGLPVGTGRIELFCNAAALVAPRDFYWAGRATLVSSHEHVVVYDRVFRSFFGGEVSVARPGPLRRPRVDVAVGASDPARTEAGAAAPRTALASSIEVLRRKSFARCTDEELAQLAELMTRMRVLVPPRKTRRRRPGRGGELDLRRTLRRSLRTQGEPLELARRERRRRSRRLVLLLDVSGSMTAYSRALLVFAHAALRADRRWEAFCFGTRLTRVTDAIAVGGADEALDRAAKEVFDWDGGTRIGESLKAFLDGYGHAGLARGAVVVLCSDGLDRGDPEVLGEQMARLSRLAYRVVWLNPLKEDPLYEPLARGMRAALPHVDLFAPGHDLASLEHLGEELAKL